MAEGGEGKEGAEEAFSFMDKVRFMMYGEQEKEAFLIEKKEKEEKKKAKKLEAESRGEEIPKQKKQTVFGKIKSFVTGSQSPEDKDSQMKSSVSENNALSTEIEKTSG